MESARQADPRPRASLAVPGAPPAVAWLRRGGPAAQRRHSAVRPRAQGPQGSFDEGNMDYKLAKELDHATWDVRRAAVTKHLELLYQASQSQSEVRRPVCRRPRARDRRAGAPWLGLAATAAPSPLAPAPLAATFPFPACCSLADSSSAIPVVQRTKVEQCECCSGSGERECGWCHGTGKWGRVCLAPLPCSVTAHASLSAACHMLHPAAQRCCFPASVLQAP